ncbi:MAG: hypothetical protein ACT4PT_00095 [Methanobacteriota archaeon]
MLDVRYSPELPRAMIDLIEHHARATGLPLEMLELIGQDLAVTEGFIVACEDGRCWEYVATVDAAAMMAKLAVRTAAARLVTPGIRAATRGDGAEA